MSDGDDQSVVQGQLTDVGDGEASRAEAAQSDDESPGAAKRLRLEEVKAGFAKAFDLGVSQLQDTLLKQLDNDFCKDVVSAQASRTQPSSHEYNFFEGLEPVFGYPAVGMRAIPGTQEIQLSASIKVLKVKLLDVLNLIERQEHVQGMIQLVMEATGRNPSRYSITGQKKVDNVRIATLIYPTEVVAVVLGFYRQKLARQHREAFCFSMGPEDFALFCPKAAEDFNNDTKFDSGNPYKHGSLGKVGKWINATS